MVIGHNDWSSCDPRGCANAINIVITSYLMPPPYTYMHKILILVNAHKQKFCVHMGTYFSDSLCVCVCTCTCTCTCTCICTCEYVQVRENVSAYMYVLRS